MAEIAKKALFLDRDGVINIGAEVGEYITSIQNFRFAPGALDIIKDITDELIPIFIITNQQCIGKGIVSSEEVSELHSYMIQEIARVGGKIESVLVCPHLLSDNCACRKPKPGMIHSVLSKNPSLDPLQCLFVGDSESDIEAGKAAGVYTLHIEKNNINSARDEIMSFFENQPLGGEGVFENR